MMTHQTTQHSTAQVDKMLHDQEVNTLLQQSSHLLLRVAAGHLLLELFLQLLAGANGLLVAGEVRQLLQPGISEVLRKMIATPFVGRKKLLLAEGEIQSTEFRNQEQGGFFVFVFLHSGLCAALTISLLSMPTLRRLAATELMSFSLIHDLNSLTAKAADTPDGKRKSSVRSECPRTKVEVGRF